MTSKTLRLRKGIVALLVAAAAFYLWCFRFLPAAVRSVEVQRLAETTPVLAVGVLAFVKFGILLGTSACGMVALNFLETHRAFARREDTGGTLPPWPYDPSKTQLIVGEIHEQTGERSEDPGYLILPEKGLVGSVGVFGAPRRGKTSAALYQYLDQLIGLHRDEPSKQLGIFFIDPKGNSGEDIRQMCAAHGREKDYYELTFPRMRHNVLSRADLSPTVLAGLVFQLMRNAARGGQSENLDFWSRAAQGLCAQTLRLCRLAYRRPPTFIDAYRTSTPKAFKRVLEEARAWIEAHPDELGLYDREELEQLDYWYRDNLTSLSVQTRSGIAETLNSLCAMFDEPMLRRCVCPPPRPADWQAQLAVRKKTWDETAGELEAAMRGGNNERIRAARRRYAEAQESYECPDWETFEGFEQLLDQGKVVVLSMPLTTYKTVGSIVGTMEKLNFYDSCLGRLTRAGRANGTVGRTVCFMADEFDQFASADDGDFWARCPEAKVVNIVALHGYASLVRALGDRDLVAQVLSTMSTKIWFGVECNYTAEEAAKLCGKVEREKMSRTISSGAQRSHWSFLDRRSVGEGAISESASTNWTLREEYLFPPRVFTTLKVNQAVVKAFDGVSARDPWVCYMRPYYERTFRSWFDSPAATETPRQQRLARVWMLATKVREAVARRLRPAAQGGSSAR